MGNCSCGGSCDSNITSVKVLGSGCAKCHKLLENTKTALKNKGIDADVDYVTDLQKVVSYGVMSTPALVINEKIASVGRVLSVSEIENLI